MMHLFMHLLSVALLPQWIVQPTDAFPSLSGVSTTSSLRPLRQQRHLPDGRSSAFLRFSGRRGDDDDTNPASTAEAQRLLAKAKAIRESLPDIAATAADRGSLSERDDAAAAAGKGGDRAPSKFSLPSAEENGFRIYVDVGRERGTWMDPRWAASGRRIECTVDVAFPRPAADDGEDAALALASEDIAAGLVKMVASKSSSVSAVYKLRSGPYARLRGGFDEMVVSDGGYCVESPASASLSSSSTLRFCLMVGGAADGDVTIPEGKLYFALPYFGLQTEGDGGDGHPSSANTTPKMILSNKEGTITVKQMGWNTGWFREESRILGVFRAVPLEKAQARDRF